MIRLYPVAMNQVTGSLIVKRLVPPKKIQPQIRMEVKNRFDCSTLSEAYGLDVQVKTLLDSIAAHCLKLMAWMFKSRHFLG